VRRLCISALRTHLLLPFLSLTACPSIGPATVIRDRFDYTSAVGESWKSQMLHNLVKMRYGDIPVFMTPWMKPTSSHCATNDAWRSITRSNRPR